ncbi:MAG: HEAT repeat domain-containing protein [Planctomycetota bacterium]
MTRAAVWVMAVLLVFGLAFSGVAPAKEEGKSSDWAEKLVGASDADERIDAGVKLGWKDPDALALALDQVVKAKAEGDAQIIAAVAVKTRVVSTRYLLAWALSKLEGAAVALRERIDNDHPWETMRAMEILGILKDRDSKDAMLQQLRNDNMLVAVQAAKSLGRMGDKKLASEMAEACLTLDDKQVRIHVAWAVQDLLKSQKGAMGAFAKHQRKKGTAGFRAKEAMSILEDEKSPPVAYKLKLDSIRKMFAPKRGRKSPPVNGPSENKDRFVRVLAQMKKDTPDYWHLVSMSLREVTISGEQQLLYFDTKKLNFRFTDLGGWGERSESEMDELYAYYLIRYAAIIFLGGHMGEAQEGQRGWEKGVLEAYWYAMEYTKIAVSEDPTEFFLSVINKRPPPWG